MFGSGKKRVPWDVIGSGFGVQLLSMTAGIHDASEGGRLTARVGVKSSADAVVFMDLGTEVRVVAVAHTKRRPGYWLDRVEGKGSQ